MTLGSWLLRRLRGRRGRIGCGRLGLVRDRARERDLRLRLVRRTARVSGRADLLCALHGTVDTGAVDRRIVFRLQNRSERLRHWHGLSLTGENAMDVHLDPVPRETLALRVG